MIPSDSEPQGISKIVEIIKQNEYLVRNEDEVLSYITERRKKKSSDGTEFVV